MGIALLKGTKVERLRLAGQAAAGTLADVAARLAPGITTHRGDGAPRKVPGTRRA